jgi:uncharacterized protein (TIGR00369 family)
MGKLIDFFDKAPIKKTFGMDFSYDEKGEAVFVMPYNPDLDHALGGIHGGIISTLLDNAGWFTIAPHYETWIATVDLNVQLLDHAKEIGLTARGVLVRAGKRLAMARMEVHTDEGKLVATATGTFSVTSVPLGG